MSEVLSRLHRLEAQLSRLSDDDKRLILFWAASILLTPLLLGLTRRALRLGLHVGTSTASAAWRLVTPKKQWSEIGSNLRCAILKQRVKKAVYVGKNRLRTVYFDGNLEVHLAGVGDVGLNGSTVSNRLGRWEMNQLLRLARERGEEYLRAQEVKEHFRILQESANAAHATGEKMAEKSVQSLPANSECYAAQKVREEIDFSKMTGVASGITLTRDKAHDSLPKGCASTGIKLADEYPEHTAVTTHCMKTGTTTYRKGPELEKVRENVRKYGDGKLAPDALKAVTVPVGCRLKDGFLVGTDGTNRFLPLKNIVHNDGTWEIVPDDNQATVTGDSIDKARHETIRTGNKPSVTFNSLGRPVAQWKPEVDDGDSKAGTTKSAQVLRKIRELRALGLGADEIRKHLLKDEEDDGDSDPAPANT